MSNHIFYPPPELPNQVVAYASALQNHASEFGAVVGNSAAELAPVVAEANRLKPLADEIEQLQITLASKTDAYHKAAAPLWTQFSEKLEYARTYAEKKSIKSLQDLLLNYRHHAGRHAAKQAAQATAPATK